MPRNVKYLERFEYVCRECDKKGTVLDVLLNPDVLLIRGFCPLCKKRGTYKVIDIEALRQDHEAIAREESQGKQEKVWRWEVQNRPPKPDDNKT